MSKTETKVVLPNNKTGSLYGSVNKLVEKIENGEMTYAQAYAGLLRISKGDVIPTWNVWKSIEIGTHSDLSLLVDEIPTFKKTNWYLKEEQREIIKKSHISLSPVEKDIKLVRIQPKQLGLEEYWTHEDLCRNADECGLALCPQETGIQLLRQCHADLKEAMDGYNVVSEPITSDSKSPYLLEIMHYNYWLGAVWDNGTALETNRWCCDKDRKNSCLDQTYIFALKE